MAPVYIPEPDSFWNRLRRALEARRAGRRQRRQDAAAAIVAACWPDRRPAVVDREQAAAHGR